MRELKFLLMALVVAIGALSTVGMAVENTGNHLFWKATGPEGSAFLLGSVHFGDDSLYPLAPVVTRAFAQSDALAVELDALALDPLAAAALFARHGMYSSGESLQARVKPATWDALTEASRLYGLPVEIFQVQKPWLAALSLSALGLKRAGYEETLGIDYHFLRLARDSGKPVIELESITQQLELFEQFSSDEQETFLIQALRDLDRGPDYLGALIGAWKAGDADALAALISESFADIPAAARLQRLLFTDRNLAMTGKIEQMMARGQRIFVVVGAGHLVGDDGIVRLLRERGYGIERF